MSYDDLNEKKEILEECLEYMERVLNQLDDVCSKLRKKIGILNINDISEGMEAVIRIITHTQSVTNIKIDAENITGFLSDMLDGIENGDYNLVADVMEYEIKPLYEEWSEIISGVLSND